ncbi:MAG: hypothetical protein L0211_05235 [Planctomycetaceae bacterium]|nr:hypothetical protein [Planctomycetaceae bacterium]
MSSVRHIRLLFTIALLLVLPAACQAVDLSGCWSGSWESCSTGHKGPLWAEFVPCGGNQYEVHFRGRFFKIMPFKYSVTMAAEERDGVVYLSGSKYLGRMVGTFSFTATATDTRFNANYSSCKDNGQFTLSRCSYACGK